MARTRREIDIARRRIPLIRVGVNRMKRRRGLAARRQEMAQAAKLAWYMHESPAFARTFVEIADSEGIPETRAGGGDHHRLLRYLGLDGPASSMSRANRQIEACLRAGWDKDEIERRILERGPSSLI
jgi:hypothetical protein